jgi:hypothetical protein
MIFFEKLKIVFNNILSGPKLFFSFRLLTSKTIKKFFPHSVSLLYQYFQPNVGAHRQGI